MLRGAIDFLTHEEIGGWIYSECGSVRKLVVLAFMGDQCIGSGGVSLFRQDLLDAGLGDGFLGFRFRISTREGEDLGRIVVKLEGSDLVLPQPGNAGLFARGFPKEPPKLTLEWMRAKGWLAQSDYDFLQGLRRRGVYEKMLSTESSDDYLARVSEEVQRCLELTVLGDIELMWEAGSDVSDVCDQWKNGECPVIGIAAEGKLRVRVEDPSDKKTPLEEDSRQEYWLGPSRLLLVDRTKKRVLPIQDAKFLLFKGKYADAQ